jgi:hypothetical protein
MFLCPLPDALRLIGNGTRLREKQQSFRTAQSCIARQMSSPLTRFVQQGRYALPPLPSQSLRQTSSHQILHRLYYVVIP